ncbi:MAG: hypothetical protein Q8918_07980 [Bacteroidota bacterium]|nr:hypothetical protein [Bacteroidota bacterium]MDP4211275.1 hypothetical protein [Bacteroidota bacterium]MDP4250036.1 hypothetical protein [Bacteroidota bacterium]
MGDQDIRNEDYISVSHFKNGIRSFLKVLFDSASFFVHSLRNNRLVFLLIICSGPVFGAVYYYFISPRLYEYSLMGEYNTLTRRNYSEIFNQLNIQILNNSKAELANELHIDKNIANKLVRFEFLSLDGKKISSDTSTKQQGFLIAKVTLRDSVNTEELQNAIVGYINNLPYLKKLKEGERLIYDQSLHFITNEQNRLDSLKELYNRFIAAGKLPSTFYNNAFDPAEIYKRSNELQEQKNEWTRWQATRAQSFSLIDGFKIMYNPSRKTLAADFFISGLISLLLAFFICLVIEIRANLK